MSNRSAAQEATTNKRVRFETDSPAPPSSPISSPPVKFAIDNVCMFLETLQPSLGPVIKKIGEKHITLFKNLHRKNNSLTKLKDDVDTIPRSVNVLINFKLRASQKTKATAEFTSIKKETSDIIESFCKSMKKQVMSIINFDIKD